MTTSPARRIALACLLLSSALSACGREHGPNVVLVTIDTLRADRLGCYGFGLAHTPAIDRLAAEGVRCLDATSSAPITLPAHSSIMTGLYPPAHGVRDNGNYELGADALTLAERLGEAGYRTAAFVSAAVLARRYGLDQGFEVYDDDLWAEDAPELFMIRDRAGGRTADRALAWLDGWWADASRRPFFAWVHLFDPHQPYQARSFDLAAIAPTAYDAEVAEADRAVGRLVDWLERRRILDGTLVILTADHGESLGEHGEPTHGIFIYDATIRVPLIWRLPGVFPATTTYGGPVRHIDIVPTVLSLLGIPGRETTEGTDLVQALQGRGAPPNLTQYAEARLAEDGFGMAPLVGLRRAGRKWIEAPHPELYDLRADPRELTNRYPADPDGPSLQAALRDVIAASEARVLAAPTREIDHETEEMLRALGYLAPPEQRAEMAGMDPKDGMALYAKLQEARNLAQAGEWSRSEALLRDLIAAAPQNVTARNVLALALIQRGASDEAEAEYRASLAQQPRQHRVLCALGVLALQRGDLERAEQLLSDALALAPAFVEAMSNLGFVAAMRGDDAAAQAWYERAIATDPTYPHVYRRLADLYYDRKAWAEALEYYRRVLRALPRYFDVLIQAGNAARFLGERQTAEAYYAEAGRVRPDSWIPPYNIACLQALAGDSPAALGSLEQAADLGLATTTLLTQNDDFDGLHGRREWAGLVDRIQVAEATQPRPEAARRPAR